MQSLRLTSVRRLCLAVTTSSFRPPPNLLLAPLVYHRQPFTSTSTRWFSSTTPFHRQTTEGGKEGGVGGAEKNRKKVTNTLFVGNVPYSTTQHELREIFSEYGPVRAIRLGMGSDYKSLGYAHIEFVSSEYVVEAIKAHEVAPLEIEGRAVRFDYERPKRPAPPQPSPRAVESDYEPSPTLFVGNLPFGATTKDIFQVLNPLGKVVDIRLARTWRGESKGFAHIDFANTAEAEQVVKYYESNSIQILDRWIWVDRTKPAGQDASPSRRLHFFGWGASSSSLRAHFGPLAGKIVDVCFFDDLGQNVTSAAGFIEFTNLKTAKEALRHFNTPELSLAYARPKKDSEPTSGGRRDEHPTGFDSKSKTSWGQDSEPQ